MQFWDKMYGFLSFFFKKNLLFSFHLK
uniref:Uncharacterized protein n=1 Tax=Rhizophora mucronata TaxID=61149 RepID=A0A2P2P8Q0_RHIMU